MQKNLFQQRILQDNSKQSQNEETTRHKKISVGEQYELPAVEDQTAIFTVDSGAKISDYKWIGLYNRCERVRFIICAVHGIHQSVCSMTLYSTNKLIRQ